VPSLATFNVNNLFVRYRFGETFPGDAGSVSHRRNYRVRVRSFLGVRLVN
jgi:hypothetical protein